MAVPKQALLIGIGATTVAGGGVGVYLLSQDKTIEHRLIREGEKLADSEEEYQIAFIERKSDTTLINTLDGIEAGSSFTEGGSALKTWCEKNKELNLSKENVDNILPKVKKYCTKPSSTIEERYTKLGKQLISGDKWKEKVKNLKGPSPKDDALEADLKLTSLGDDSDNSKGGNALKNWCNEKIKIQLSKDKTEEVWKKVEKRCVEP